MLLLLLLLSSVSNDLLSKGFSDQALNRKTQKDAMKKKKKKNPHKIESHQNLMLSVEADSGEIKLEW